MKIAITLALAGAAASGAAQAQLIANTPATAGGSDLVLFVSDLTTGAYFIQDLGNPLDSIYSQAKVVSDGVLTSPGHFTTPTTGVAGPDAALATFLGGLNTGSDNIQYSFIASDATSTAFKLGAQRFLTTSTLDLSGGNPIGSQTAFSNSLTSQAGSNFASFVSWINANCLTGNTCASGWGDSSALGQTSGGKGAPTSWVSASYMNGASLGTASTMYLLATSGGGASPVSNSYIGGMVDVSAAGVISVTNGGPAVPLPAAVWLFGSGLLGLLGVGRRTPVA
jgi:hypothetical protein